MKKDENHISGGLRRRLTLLRCRLDSSRFSREERVGRVGLRVGRRTRAEASSD